MYEGVSKQGSLLENTLAVPLIDLLRPFHTSFYARDDFNVIPPWKRL